MIAAIEVWYKLRLSNFKDLLAPKLSSELLLCDYTCEGIFIDIDYAKHEKNCDVVPLHITRL